MTEEKIDRLAIKDLKNKSSKDQKKTHESDTESKDSTQEAAILELEVIGMSRLLQTMQNASLDELRLYRHSKINEYLKQIQEQLNTTRNYLKASN